MVDSISHFVDNQGEQIKDDSGALYNGEVVFSGSVKTRFRDGYIHSDSGPAVEGPGDHKEYWVDGYLHRSDGPAVISSDGSFLEYWEKGKQIRIEEK